MEISLILALLSRKILIRSENYEFCKNDICRRSLRTGGQPFTVICFPAHEQREEGGQKRQIIWTHRTTTFRLIYDGEVFVGMILYSRTEAFIREHFVLDSGHVISVMGSALEPLLKEKGKTLILKLIRRQMIRQRGGKVSMNGQDFM